MQTFRKVVREAGGWHRGGSRGECESVSVWYSSGGRGGGGRVGLVETRRVEDGKADGWDDRGGPDPGRSCAMGAPFRRDLLRPKGAWQGEGLG